MKIKNAKLTAEINHKAQILLIDTELFISSYFIEENQNSEIILNSLKELNEKFIKIKKIEDLSDKLYISSREKISSIIDIMQEVKVQSSMAKNEKIAVINQLHELKDIFVVKN